MTIYMWDTRVWSGDELVAEAPVAAGAARTAAARAIPYRTGGQATNLRVEVTRREDRLRAIRVQPQYRLPAEEEARTWARPDEHGWHRWVGVPAPGYTPGHPVTVQWWDLIPQVIGRNYVAANQMTYQLVAQQILALAAPFVTGIRLTGPRGGAALIEVTRPFVGGPVDYED